MCTYREAHWYNSPLKSNTHTHTCMSRYSTETETHSQRPPVTSSPEGLCGKCWYPGMFWISKVALLKFWWHFQSFSPLRASTIHTHTHTHTTYLHAHKPSWLESEPGGVSTVSAEGAERPHDEFEASVVNVPKVDVFMGDLHGAFPIDVQVRGRHQVHIEAFWKN